MPSFVNSSPPFFHVKACNFCQYGDAHSKKTLTDRRVSFQQVACLQLVEQGKIGVDDAEALGKYVPELALENLQILEGYDDNTGKAIYRKPKTGITLRMLLTHTAGELNRCSSLEVSLTELPTRALLYFHASSERSPRCSMGKGEQPQELV